MRPTAGELLHFSEDPTIRSFDPHVAATARQPDAYVWAVDAEQAPAYWFPRQCPRAMAWSVASTTVEDRLSVLGPSASRVHMIEYGWLGRMQSTQVYAYRFAVESFRRLGDAAWVTSQPVQPLGEAEPIGNLLALHEEAGIELRLADDLGPWWRAVIASTVGFSGIRLRNARAPL
ncbi:MAG TPA: hypothetical protein VE132_12910 [Micromonosporaceae bacterium]|nr:hypothetical protein [Micromonosporaceae bacterium]